MCEVKPVYVHTAHAYTLFIHTIIIMIGSFPTWLVAKSKEKTRVVEKVFPAMMIQCMHRKTFL